MFELGVIEQLGEIDVEVLVIVAVLVDCLRCGPELLSNISPAQSWPIAVCSVVHEFATELVPIGSTFQDIICDSCVFQLFDRRWHTCGRCSATLEQLASRLLVNSNEVVAWKPPRVDLPR